MSKNEIKLVLVIDSSEAFLRTKTEEYFVKWGFERSNVKELTEWQFIPRAASLFGDIMMTHLDLTKKDDLKSFVKEISDKKAKESFKDNWYGNGTIITTTTAVGTKKIETLVKDSGGTIIKKEKSNVRKKEIFSQLNLRQDVRSAVDAYVGEDYELMLSFTNEVAEMTPEEQKAITLDKVFSYFPPIPGSVPPWDFLNALMNGKTGEAIELFNRTIQHTHPLVCLLFLNKKMSLLYRIKLASQDGYNSNEAVAKAIGEKGGPELWSISKLTPKISVKSAEQIALIANQLESDIKGGSAVKPEVLFIEAITKIGILLGNTR